MSLVDVKLDATELEDVLEAMAKVDTASTMQVAAEMLVSGVSDRYQSEGDGDWPPHAPSTVASMGPHQLMQYTGILSGSTNAEWGDDFAEANTAVDYVKFHLDGGPVIPKRNPFELRDDVIAEVLDFIVDDIGRRMIEAA
jgi:phage gpG-like protein